MQTQKSIKNIVFDLGGVIINTDAGNLGRYLQKLGIKETGWLLSEQFKAITYKFECGDISPESFRQKVCNLAQTSLDEPLFDEWWNSMLLDIPTARIQTIEQAKKHYNVFLLSNTNETHYNCFLQQFQSISSYRSFDNLFEKAYFSHNLHLAKPDKRIFKFVLNAENLNPAETLFIDDNADNIASAQSLGINCYWLNNKDLTSLFYNGLLVE